MKTINVIQVATVEVFYEKNDYGFFVGRNYNVKPLTIATAEVDNSVDVKDIMDEVWHLCNILCWGWR